MDESFDPYRKWLGIPPEEQPPHHYRLLGLEMFEANPDVIVNAADARMTFLRTLSTDQHADMAERIALQIKEAQACLIDPAKKAFYDGQLKRRIAALQKSPYAASVTNGMSANHQTPAWTAPPTNNAAPAVNVSAPMPVSRRNRRWTWPQTAGVLLGSIALVCVLIFVLGKHGKNAEANSSKPIAQSVPVKENGSGAKSESPAAKVDSPPDKKASEPASTTGKENPPKVEGNPSPEKDNASETLPKAGVDNPFEVMENEPNGDSETIDPSKIVGIDDGGENSSMKPEGDSTPSKGNDNSSSDESPAQPEPRRSVNSRRPIPDEAERQAADKTVREIYGQKISAAKSSKDKRDLADEIRRKAIDTKGDTTALYALMTVAFQLAGESGHLEHASEYADWFARYFEVDAWDLKADAATKAVASARNNLPGIDGDDLLLDCKQLALEAKRAGQIEAAGKIAKAAMPLAKKDQTLLGDLNKLVREIDKLKPRYQSFRKALETLKEKPDDPDANALAGRWVCFESREWDKGLAMLAKSSDAALAKLAAKDIGASEDSSRRMEVADAWWEIAQREKNDAPYKPGMLARSGYWYRKALPTLSGLNKTKAETRMKSIASAADEDGETSSGRGVIKAGNVALAKNGTVAQGFRSNGFKLIDGNSENPGSDYQATYSPVPCEWTITFNKVYQLREIRFYFYNGDRRFYHYTLDVSADGENYKTIVERNQGQWFGRQDITFPAQPVKSIKLYGTYSYNNRIFAVTEFEAYCIPPKP